MGEGPDGRPSLAEYDYFGERPPRHRAAAPEPDEEQAWYEGATRPRWRGPPALVGAAATCVFLAVAGWFVAGYRDLAAYAWLPPQPPADLGDVAHLPAGALHHNAYVRVHGITEHRGMQQELLRGLGIRRRLMWYFRLLGSRGIFVEVEPDAARFGTTTEVTVTGRAVDPRRAPIYAALLASYAADFHAPLHGTEMIVQDGVRPGENRRVYAAAAALIVVVALLNTVLVVRRLGWR